MTLLIGYESRVQINLNPWGANPFLLFVIPEFDPTKLS